MADKDSERESKESKGGPKPKGWYSRRHEDTAPHSKATATYLNYHGPNARRQGADARLAIRATRSPQEQLRVLDERLGVGKGASRERARLKHLISATS